ncbi:hypothetical protein [Blastomonas sp. AAP53]|uniref:hypothetical protein n=1 Tax=Blastomonas sp. AAP53 TaxID=1248760 RepID=UPI001266F592|nr:hypothetical protein [Blastomonas sp. AAP53]
MRLPVLLAVAAFVLASCTHAAPTAAPSPSSPAGKGSNAELLADALAQADRAASAGDDTGLARPLAMIAALDARPLDAEGQAGLERWRRRSPDTTAPLRGRTLGPGYRHGTLNAGGDLRIEQTFLSGQKASIALSTPDGAKLRLQVVDGAAHPVCQYEAASPSCEWIPIYTQRHVIRLINPGRRKTRFYLVID